MRHKTVLTSLVFLAAGLLAAPAAAQEEEFFDLFRPRLDFWAEGAPERELTDSDTDGFPDVDGQAFRLGGANLMAHIPLGRARFSREGSVLGRQFFAHAALGRTRTEMEFLDRDPVLLTGLLGGTVLFLSRQENLYAAGAFASFAAEEEAREDSDPRTTGFFLAARRGANPDLLWIFGGAFTYQYGKGLPLPVFGFIRTLNPDWKIGGFLPFTLQATRQTTPRRKLQIFFRVKGNRYDFANKGDFPGQPEKVDLSLVEGRVGGSLEILPSRSFGLVMEAGLLAGRRLIFAEEDDEFIDARARPAGYLRLVTRFSFGESLLTESEAPPADAKTP